MSTEQEIISYKPDLNIYGKPGKILDSDYASTSNNIQYTSGTSSTSTRISRLLAVGSPSDTANLFSSVIEDVNSSLKSIESNFTGNKYEAEYVAAKTEDEKNQVLDQNKVDIDFGSSSLEIYSYLEKIYEDINKILDLYIKCVFGDNVNPADTDAIVKEYISKIQALEANNQYEKVNYASLYYDISVSYALSDFMAVLQTTCDDLSSLNVQSKNIDLDNAAKSLLEKNFNKETTNLDSLTQGLSNCSNDLLIALNNFYLEKQDFLSYLDTFAKISSYANGKTELAEMKSNCKDTMNKRYDNLVKAYMNYNLTCGDASISVSNKAKYRSFF